MSTQPYTASNFSDVVDGKEVPAGGFVDGLGEYYQTAGFSCRENALAITKIEEALHWLNARTNRRVKANVEGTHEGN